MKQDLWNLVCGIDEDEDHEDLPQNRAISYSSTKVLDEDEELINKQKKDKYIYASEIIRCDICAKSLARRSMSAHKRSKKHKENNSHTLFFALKDQMLM